MRFAIAQINTIPSDFEGNFEKIRRAVEFARENKADIVIFPELSLCGYLNLDTIYTEEFIAENNRYLRMVERLSDGVGIIIGHITARKNPIRSNRYDISSLRFGGRYSYYNSASFCFNRKTLYTYHKQKLPSFDVFNEERYFKSGIRDGIFRFRGLKIGINICEDIWYADGPYERQGERQVDVIVNISASPFYAGKPEIRLSMISKKAKRYGVFTIYVNAIGGQDELIYDGNSMVFDRDGHLLRLGRSFEEDIFVVDTSETSKTRVSFNRDEMLFRGIICGIRDYFEKNRIENAIIGLSGGVDSALVSTLASIALGKERVINVFMPSQFTSEESRILVEDFIKRQGTRLIDIPITRAFSILKEELKDIPVNSTLPYENIQSRIRGGILMFVANSHKGAVIATGNKNEIALGYNTLYGDTVGAIAPIGDLYKDEVISLCKYINRNFRDIIPEGIINRVPTAELRENQKDEDDLPPYSVTNRLLYEMIENNRSDRELIKLGFDEEIISRVHSAIKRSEFKRRQMPPIIKLKQKSFGMGRRIPITSYFRYMR
jgi:NAD+ synthase (glutamine-hydrolysing)